MILILIKLSLYVYVRIFSNIKHNFVIFLLTIIKKNCIIVLCSGFYCYFIKVFFSHGEITIMIKGYEIERKFLVEMPDVNTLDVKRKMDIIQTYLKDGENNIQRRVRCISENGNTQYIYTEKLFITAVTRKEMEYEIDENEYNRLILQAREECLPINKTRYCFDYDGQLFELDVYPFSENLATMELELSSEKQEISFPDNISILKEVTGNSDYSNISLANAGIFP